MIRALWLRRTRAAGLLEGVLDKNFVECKFSLERSQEDVPEGVEGVHLVLGLIELRGEAPIKVMQHVTIDVLLCMISDSKH